MKEKITYLEFINADGVTISVSKKVETEAKDHSMRLYINVSSDIKVVTISETRFNELNASSLPGL